MEWWLDEVFHQLCAVLAFEFPIVWLLFAEDRWSIRVGLGINLLTAVTLSVTLGILLFRGVSVLCGAMLTLTLLFAELQAVYFLYLLKLGARLMLGNSVPPVLYLGRKIIIMSAVLKVISFCLEPIDSYLLIFLARLYFVTFGTFLVVSYCLVCTCQIMLKAYRRIYNSSEKPIEMEDVGGARGEDRGSQAAIRKSSEDKTKKNKSECVTEHQRQRETKSNKIESSNPPSPQLPNVQGGSRNIRVSMQTQIRTIYPEEKSKMESQNSWLENYDSGTRSETIDGKQLDIAKNKNKNDRKNDTSFMESKKTFDLQNNIPQHNQNELQQQSSREDIQSFSQPRERELNLPEKPSPPFNVKETTVDRSRERLRLGMLNANNNEQIRKRIFPTALYASIYACALVLALLGLVRVMVLDSQNALGDNPQLRQEMDSRGTPFLVGCQGLTSMIYVASSSIRCGCWNKREGLE
mmetsp:Transcript_38589/g.61881  ORF Transcript_38589/g.61881 Transcript_38589/m.61881 type:complete len:465 (-) Transcript_38589:233-1627(-)